MASLKVYGVDGCSVTQVVRAHLLRSGVQHDYVDLDKNPGAVAKAVTQNVQERHGQVAEVVAGGAGAPGKGVAVGESAPLSPHGERPPPPGGPRAARSPSTLPER